MTVTAAQQTVHQEEQNAILTLAVAEMLRELADFEALSPDAAARAARQLIPELVADFGDDAAVLNRDWYDVLRAAIAAGVDFAAMLAPTWNPDQIQTELGWALLPLFPQEAGTPDFEATLGRLAGKLQWMIGESGRDTIGYSAQQDPIGTTYARHAAADACAFCRLMATRGATYLSRESALFVTGEVDPRDTDYTLRGPRGTRALGEKYHDNCRCIAVPQFPGDTLDAAPYVDQWMQDYKAAAAAAGGPRRANLKDILAHMRAETGAR